MHISLAQGNRAVLSQALHYYVLIRKVIDLQHVRRQSADKHKQFCTFQENELTAVAVTFADIRRPWVSTYARYVQTSSVCQNMCYAAY